MYVVILETPKHNGTAITPNILIERKSSNKLAQLPKTLDNPMYLVSLVTETPEEANGSIK